MLLPSETGNNCSLHLNRQRVHGVPDGPGGELVGYAEHVWTDRCKDHGTVYVRDAHVGPLAPVSLEEWFESLPERSDPGYDSDLLEFWEHFLGEWSC